MLLINFVPLRLFDSTSGLIEYLVKNSRKFYENSFKFQSLKITIFYWENALKNSRKSLKHRPKILRYKISAFIWNECSQIFNEKSPRFNVGVYLWKLSQFKWAAPGVLEWFYGGCMPDKNSRLTFFCPNLPFFCTTLFLFLFFTQVTILAVSLPPREHTLG